MFATFSRLAAEAVCEAARQPGFSGRRLALSDLHGLEPSMLFEALRARFDTTVEVLTGTHAHSLDAITLAPGRALLVYLVDESTPTNNSGSAGFAATLRTQFLEEAHEERVLLILDKRPVETVRSATEDAALLPQLSWEVLVERALQAARETSGKSPSRLAEWTARAFAERAPRSPEALDDFSIWAARHAGGSDSGAGRELWTLGCFISDPEAHTDSNRLIEGARWRADLDERYASQSKSWGVEARKLLSRKHVSPAVMDTVIGAAGAFGIDYSLFSLADLKRREDPPTPLQTDEYEPALAARSALRGTDSLVIWLAENATEIQLRLAREIVLGDDVRIVWASGTETAALLEPGSTDCTVALSQDPGWLFGTLELYSLGHGESAEVGETLPLAIYRSNGDWFPVEDTLAVEPFQAAFRCNSDPVVIAYGEHSVALGRGSYEQPESEAELVQLEVRFREAVEPLPAYLVGEEAEGEPPDDEPPGDPPDGDPPVGEPVASDAASVPHALLEAGRAKWPEARLIEQGEDGPWQVEFAAGQQRRLVHHQRPGGIAGADLEREILTRPEWTAYIWTPPGRLARAPGLVLAGGDLDESLAAAFMGAREAFFGIALIRGSVYAVDPRCPEAEAYTRSYAALLTSIPAGERYISDWDALLLCDAVFIGGRQDLLFAPTSPLAVAFHAGVAQTFSEWVRADDVPPKPDIASLSLRHALPLVSAKKQWYEAAAVEELLWRRYIPLAGDAPGLPERNAAYIAERLRFFLRVHPAYNRADQTISVAFYQPGDGGSVFQALRAFYRRERAATEYRLPRLHVWIVGGSPGLEREVVQELAGGRQDDLDRLVQSRITVSVRGADDPPAFAHVSFLFRSPGNRAPRLLPMSDRPATTHLGGLAASPGRKVYAERNQVFAWGTWADASGGDYLELIRRSLELVGGQPTGRVSPGWTQMASASVDNTMLDELYRERSVWVVHLDRLIGIEAFGGTRQLIEYEERADPDEPGYDGITATEQIDPYLESVGRALTKMGTPKETALQRLLQMLNAVSGRWAIELLQRGDTDILQRIGFVAAISALEQLEATIGSGETGTGVVVALDEFIPGRPHAGMPRFSLPVPLPEGRMCDDLLLLWLPSEVHAERPVTIRGAVIEVKYAGRGRANTDTARLEILRTRGWLHEAFNSRGSSRAFRARDLAELITAAVARAQTFELGRKGASPTLDPALRKIVAGEYNLDLTHWRAGEPFTGMVISVEAESEVAAHQSELPPPGERVEVVRLGRPVLQQLVSAGKVQGDAAKGGPSWTPISFDSPPGFDGDQGATDTAPISPDLVTRPTPGSAPAGDSQDEPQVAPHATPLAPTGRLPDVEELARALDSTMEKYKLQTEPFQPTLADIGPNVIRFRTRALGPLSVADVERRARDIGREIGAPGAVIVSQEPRYICIDVPREERQSILYRDVTARAGDSGVPGALDFILGVAPSGEVATADLARLPHLLVAGATGSGKSVFLRGLLCHLVRTRGPQQLRILLVDPKQLDFAGFASLPHLEGGRIISEPTDAMAALRETIERELEWRRPILVEAGVTSATEFYERGGTHEQLPQMVVLVDEFADLVGVLVGQERRSFDELIQRYAQLTRAFGIYLVLATQRPSVDVVTGSIKANLTARVALSLPSHRDSMTILDRAGAEDLLGNGDMLFYHSGRIERLQGAFADAQDIAHAVERWREVENPLGGRD